MDLSMMSSPSSPSLKSNSRLALRDTGFPHRRLEDGFRLISPTRSSLSSMKRARSGSLNLTCLPEYQVLAYSIRLWKRRRISWLNETICTRVSPSWLSSEKWWARSCHLSKKNSKVHSQGMTSWTGNFSISEPPRESITHSWKQSRTTLKPRF